MVKKYRQPLPSETNTQNTAQYATHSLKDERNRCQQEIYLLSIQLECFRESAFLILTECLGVLEGCKRRTQHLFPWRLRTQPNAHPTGR